MTSVLVVVLVVAVTLIAVAQSNGGHSFFAFNATPVASKNLVTEHYFSGYSVVSSGVTHFDKRSGCVLSVWNENVSPVDYVYGQFLAAAKLDPVDLQLSEFEWSCSDKLHGVAQS